MSPSNIQPSTVVAIVCEEFRVTIPKFDSTNRDANAVDARRFTAWALINLCEYSCNQAGAVVGLDHSTVVYHIRKVDDLCSTDASYYNRLQRIRQQVEQAIKNAEGLELHNIVHVALNPLQCVELVARANASPSEAMHGAVEFCKLHAMSECILDYCGHRFCITPHSDITQKLAMFRHASRVKPVAV